MSSLSSSLSAFASLLVLLVVPAYSLTCYENDSEGGITEVHNSSWSYCAFIPPTEDERTGKVFGLSSLSDSTQNYDVAFSQNDDLYSILTVCILEKYDFGRIAGNKFSRHEPEFLFRCVCNYDRCNSATTFNTYLRALKMDSL